MPRDGAGTYTLPAGNPVVTGTTVSSTVQNNTTSDIATALTNSLAKDGQTTPTANIPLGGFKLTGLGAATASTDAARFGQLPTVKRKTADESVTTSTTLQDDDDLTFAIAANEEWIATYYLSFGNSMTVSGYRTAITTPAGATQEVTSQSAFSAAADTGDGFFVTGSGTIVSSRTTSSAAQAIVLLRIWVLNGANAGSVKLQFAQNTSSATATLLRKGSCLVAHRIA